MSDDPRQLSGWALRGRRQMVAAVLLLLLLPVVGFMVGRRTPSVAQDVANAAPPESKPILFEVEERELVTEEVFRGTVVASAQMVVSRSEEAAVVTREPPPVDAALRAGRVVVELDDRPVFIMAGPVPLLADIHPGSQGSAVAQLQATLRDLDLLSDAAAGVYDQGTQGALAALYERAGYAAPEPVGGEDLRAAQAALADAESAVLSARAARAAATEAPLGERRVLNNALERAEAAVVAAEVELERATALYGVPVIAREVAFVASLPAFVRAFDGGLGSVVEPGGPIVELVTSSPIVEVTIAADDESRFAVSAEMMLRTDDGSELGLAEVVAITEAQSEAAGSGMRVARLEPSAELSRSLIGSSLQVVASRTSSDGPVLVVPVSALFTTETGSLYVRKHEEDGTVGNVGVTAPFGSGGFAGLDVADGTLSVGDLVEIGTEP